MSGEDPGHRKAGWWEEIDSSETELDDDDLDLSVEQIIEERTEDKWEIKSIIVSDRGDETLYCIVIRKGVGSDGQLLLDERYFTVDLTDPWSDSSGYSSNGISRRIKGEGSLLALKISYASLADTSLGGKRQIMEALNGQLMHNPDSLQKPVGELLDLDIQEETASPSESTGEALGPVDQPDRKGWVRCSKCGETLPEQDATRFSSGPPLGDVWVHPSGDCPEEEGDR